MKARLGFVNITYHSHKTLLRHPRQARASLVYCEEFRILSHRRNTYHAKLSHVLQPKTNCFRRYAPPLSVYSLPFSASNVQLNR